MVIGQCIVCALNPTTGMFVHPFADPLVLGILATQQAPLNTKIGFYAA